MHAQLVSAATGLIFGWSLHLYPYFVDVNSEDYGLTIHLHRLKACLSICYWSLRPLVKGAYQKIVFLFLNQNVSCGYSKEPSL